MTGTLKRKLKNVSRTKLESRSAIYATECTDTIPH